MAEYIEREAVLKIIADNCPHDKSGYNTEEEMGAGAACYYIRKAVETVPTADVVPKSKGKWKPYKDHFTNRQVGWICTNCSSVISDVSNGDTDYCPHCGAVMETEEET